MLMNKSIALMASVAVIAAIVVFITSENSVALFTLESPDSNKIPRPPSSYKMGNYGNSIEIDQLSDKVSLKQPDESTALSISEVKSNNRGMITVVYSDTRISYNDEMTMPDFLKQGGVLALHTQIGNLDVEQRIANYEKERPGHTFTINGDPAKGSEKNPDLNIPTQLTIYQSNGEQVQLLSWGSLSELIEFAKNLQ